MGAEIRADREHELIGSRLRVFHQRLITAAVRIGGGCLENPAIPQQPQRHSRRGDPRGNIEHMG